MKRQKEGVTEKILLSAQKEFLEYGFMNASLRRISLASGVSTNSIYTRFNDKAGLFEALVKEPSEKMIQVYLNSLNAVENCKNYDEVITTGSQGTDDVLNCIYQNFTAFQLIFCCSSGTKYEKFLDRLAEIEEKIYRDYIKQILGEQIKVDDFFIHAICSSSCLPLYEVVSHNLSFEEAKRFMELEEKYHYAGWKAVLGL